MFLEHVRIENIRSISCLDLELDEGEGSRRWTLIAGENGTGKSTVLKAIALALAGSDSLLSLLTDTRSWVRDGTDEGRISLRLRTQAGEPREIQLVLGADSSAASVIRRNTDGLRLLDDALAHATQNYFVVGYGPYRRITTDPAFLSKDPTPDRAQSVITMFEPDKSVHPIQSWAMQLEYRDGPEGLAVVREAVESLLPGLAFDGIDREAQTLIFRTPDGLVPLERLSDGYQNVAAWIGDLLYRVTNAFAHHRDPLRARGLLLIDEIDAHLHPSWQRQLRTFLDRTLPNFQIVATTHSALTLQQSHQGDAVVLSRDEEGRVALAPFPGDPSKLRLHQIYDLAFRISSLDSWEVERSKEVYRALSERGAGELGPDEAEQLARAKTTLEVRADLSAAPDALGNESMENFLKELNRTTSRLAQRGEGS